MSRRRRKASLGRLAAARRRDLFFVLGEPTRRRLVELIAHGEQPLARLVKFFTSTRQAINDHLLVLHQAGLVSTRIAGNRRYYGLQTGRLREVCAWLEHYERLWHRKFSAVAAHHRQQR